MPHPLEDPINAPDALGSRPPGPKDVPQLDPRQSFFRGVPWRWSDVVIGLAPSVSARTVSALIDPAWLSGAPSWPWLPISLLGEGWMLVYPLWIARRRCAELPHLPRNRTIFVESRFALLALAVVLAVQIVFHVSLISLFGDRAMPANPLEPIARSPNRVDSLGLLIMAISVAPIAEEVFFRGMFYNALRQRLHLIITAPVQAIVFGVLHPFGLVGSSAVAIYGLAFALVYEWRKTLLTAVLLHVLVNAVGMTLMAWHIAADAAAPRLGVVGETDERGCRLTMVAPDSGADTAGMRIGDVIVNLDGEPIADLTSLTKAVRSKQVGQKVTVEFIREGKTHQVEAVLKKLRE